MREFQDYLYFLNELGEVFHVLLGAMRAKGKEDVGW